MPFYSHNSSKVRGGDIDLSFFRMFSNLTLHDRSKNTDILPNGDMSSEVSLSIEFIEVINLVD